MTSAREQELTKLIRRKAFEIGFDLIGIAPFRKLEEHIPVLRNWISEGMNGEMSYLGRNFERRTDPSLLFPGTRSVIVTGLNYYTGKKQRGEGVPILSKYAYGADYHDVIIKKLNLILDFITRNEPPVNGKAFVDAAPILEKAWAREAGLGWPGRHSVIINRKIGSFFFIGILLVDITLEYDKPFTGDHCGECRLCIESCPTNAINEDHTIDARRCIAYLTIESRGPVAENFAGITGRRVFGCDKCQEVCPWNKKAKNHNTTDFELSAELEKMTAENWKNLSMEDFKRIFRNSAIGRRTYKIFMQNVTNVTKC